jgi:hypothetical protein
LVGSWSEGEQEQGDWDIWRVEASDPGPGVAVVVVAAAVAAAVAVRGVVAGFVAAGTLSDQAEAGAGFEEDGNQEEWERDHQDDEYGVEVVVVPNILADFDFDTLDTGPVDTVVVVQNRDWNSEELGLEFVYSASSKAYLVERPVVAEAGEDVGTVAGMEAGWTVVASYQVGLVVAVVD